MMQDLETTGPALVRITASLLLVLGTIYATTHHRFKTSKQKAYILSTISSGCMSLLSLWFVGTWIQGGFEAVLKDGAERFARYGTVFFRSYLIGMSACHILVVCV